ncbi:MAG TPA: hypothetical protein VM939_04880 [Gemmatimonadaceae bacterium]|nr:hypothetical protein [Gemmatimonadaceae bacterium]
MTAGSRTTRLTAADGLSDGGWPTRGVASPREETSLLGFVNILMRHRWILLVCSLIGGVIFTIRVLTERQTYNATASFAISRGRSPNAMTGVAGDLSTVTGNLVDATQSVSFYVDLVTSRTILGPIARAKYRTLASGKPAETTLADVYEIRATHPVILETRVVDELRKSITVTASGRTEVIEVRVRSPRPEIAQQIAAGILVQLDGYNLSRRQSQAAAEKEFVQKVLDEARDNLRIAEVRLNDFREVNRVFTAAPHLIGENERLEREVHMRQRVYAGLAQAYEQARIEEVRDLPAITVLEPAEAILRPDRRIAYRRVLLGVVGGLMVGIILAIISERMAEIRGAAPPVYREYSGLKSELIRGWFSRSSV